MGLDGAGLGPEKKNPFNKRVGFELRVQLWKNPAQTQPVAISNLEGLSNSGEEMYVFKSSNTCWHSTVHSKDFFNVQKKGRHLSIALNTNLFNATTLPLRLYTSFTFLDGVISIIAWILSGLTSMPH